MSNDLPGGWPQISIAEANSRLTGPGAPFEIVEAVICDQPMRVWKHAPATLAHVFEAGIRHGDKCFLVFEDERITFDAFGKATVALARALEIGGVGPGDRVAIVMRNLPEWPVAFYAAALAGAIAVPINAMWSADELVYGLVDCGAKAAIIDSERLDRLAGRLSECERLVRVIVARSSEPRFASDAERLEDIIGGTDQWADLCPQPRPDVQLVPDDDATIFYTSGTTGNPKGAVGSHRAMTSSIISMAQSAARSALRRGEPVPEPDPQAPQKSFLLVIPMFHVTGSHSFLQAALFHGSKIVLMRRWDPAEGARLIARERISSAGGVPSIAWQLLEHERINGGDLSSLEALVYGGAPSSPDLVRSITDCIPAVTLATGWGMTETSGTCTHHQAEDYVAHPDSCGQIIPICDMQIVDLQTGRPVPAGETGELCVRGATIVRGYWNKPEETERSFVEGWLRTGDLARVDEEGFCYIVDRAKDVIIRGGENIYCVEVENILYEHPDIIDAALVGLPDRVLGEIPAAVVQVRKGSEQNEKEIRSFVKARLAQFKVPEKVAFLDEALPRNSNGKILKRQLSVFFEK
ncbi:class I adenylate-forming enzyme family protein [Parasphingopyxis marina]|uniref:class I adenylate-forming enzyme family protein n=1 Tax=Parasphingopyxis marina TaxID=2761622 RepID=UPI002E28B153|nr:AMP-binding protein [Parasphingopyxis marina]